MRLAVALAVAVLPFQVAWAMRLRFKMNATGPSLGAQGEIDAQHEPEPLKQYADLCCCSKHYGALHSKSTDLPGSGMTADHLGLTADPTCTNTPHMYAPSGDSASNCDCNFDGKGSRNIKEVKENAVAYIEQRYRARKKAVMEVVKAKVAEITKMYNAMAEELAQLDNQTMSELLELGKSIGAVLTISSKAVTKETSLRSLVSACSGLARPSKEKPRVQMEASTQCTMSKLPQKRVMTNSTRRTPKTAAGLPR